MIWTSWLFWLLLALQSLVQVYFLIGCYGPGKRPALRWMTLFGVFFLGIGPVDQLIPMTMSVFGNLFNALCVWLIGWMLDRQAGWKKRLQTTALWWLAMPIVEGLCLLLVMLLYGQVPPAIASLEHGSYTPLLFFFQVLASLFLWFVYSLELRWLCANKEQDHSIVIGLMGSISLLVFLTFVFWDLKGSHQSLFLFWLPVLGLFLVHLVLAAVLIRQVRRQTLRKSSLVLNSLYGQELEELLGRDFQEEQLRRLRHDLLNWMDEQPAGLERRRFDVE